MLISKINQISIPVHDIERATAFYGDTLELPVLFSQPSMALLDCGGIRLLLSVPESEAFDHPSSTVYFQVDDLITAHEKLLSANVEFMSKPHKVAEFGGYAVWMAFFYDPDRNVMALTSEVPIGQVKTTSTS